MKKWDREGTRVPSVPWMRQCISILGNTLAENSQRNYSTFSTWFFWRAYVTLSGYI